MTQESLTEKLAAHLVRPVDAATRQRARLHLLDWLGCVAGGRGSDLAKLTEHMDPARKSNYAAMLGNLLEMDDIHRSSILHPGPVIWSALMVGQDFDMQAILDAAVIGYEATIGIGTTFDAHHYLYYHNTATAGIFGAAASVVSLFGKDRSKFVSAMGLAGSVAGGLWQMRHETSDAKQWHVERSMTNGSSAGYYAAGGMTGPRFILEGPQGLYAATCKEPKPMEFPDQWRIHEVSFKPWGACRHAHPAIDASLELKDKLGKLDGEILVETYADALTFCDRPDPQTVIDAKFSLQHAVAIVAEKGVPELADFEPDAIARHADARSRVKLRQAEDITARYPQHYGARVTCGEEVVELTDARGDPERPMREEQIIDKARALIAWGGLPESEAQRAIELALQGNDAKAIHAMLGDWLK